MACGVVRCLVFEVCSCEGVYDEVYSYEVVVACGVVVKPMYCVLVCVLM